MAKSDVDSESLGTSKTSARYAEAVRELSELTSRSMLLSSNQTQSALDDMNKARSDVAPAVTTLVEAVILARKHKQESQGATPPAPDMKTAADQYQAKRDKLFALDANVVRAMRSELGIPPP